MAFQFSFPYTVDANYNKKIAYFCMEFGIDQALKTYAGGLGFLAGSHMKSAFELKQHLIGIGILWKYGYYNQRRKPDQTMDVVFEEKKYEFLQPTDIKFSIKIAKQDVWVTAYYLKTEIFNTAPIFFLTTDLPENDYLAKTTVHKLYDSNPETKSAAAILLGEGGVKLLEQLNWEPEIYHLNESHALPLGFYLYKKYKNINEVRKRLVYTNHTPEESGNQISSLPFLDKMSFFCDLPQAEIKSIMKSESEEMNHTLVALRLSGKANAVSKLHKNTLCKAWGVNDGICEIDSITNAQNFEFWNDKELYDCLKINDIERIRVKKLMRKKELFEIIADQCGKIFNENICTLVFAKRFAEYKRPDIFFHDLVRFEKLVSDKEKPIQIIWAGKPYPMDFYGIGVFDKIVDLCKNHSNCSIITGYEINLSKILKRGADIWLNVPRLTHEASGTSGMSAAMNGAVNVGIPDGWFPEFAKDKINAFVVPPADINLPIHIQDDLDSANLYHLLESDILPTYYQFNSRWNEIVRNGLNDIIPYFDSNRLAKEYYDKMYNMAT